MSRVITFSRTFPAYHPKAGLPTFFVEKLFHSIDPEKKMNVYGREDLGYINSHALEVCEPKHHTIRSGNRWKVGDKFSPRVWSGKPYNSKMITIAPDIEIKKIWEFEVKDGKFYLNGYVFSSNISNVYRLYKLAENDGLEYRELLDWFQYPKPFKGQIICWNDKIEY